MKKTLKIGLILAILTGFFIISIVGSEEITKFTAGLSSENLTFTGDENITRYLNITRFAVVTSAYLNLTGNYVATWFLEKDIVNPSFEDAVWTGSCLGVGCFCDVDRYTDWKTHGSYSMGYILDPSEFNDECEIGDGGEFHKDVNFTDIKAIRFNLSSSGFTSLNFTLKLNGDVEYSEVLSYGVDDIEIDTSAINGIKNLTFESRMWENAFTGGIARYTYFDQIEEQHWNYTLNPYMFIGETNIWNYSGYFSLTDNKTINFSAVLNNALNLGACDCVGCSLEGNNCLIPFIFHSDEIGKLEYSAINVTWTPTPLIVTLNTPPDTSLRTSPIRFNCSVEAEANELSNITLIIWNSTNDIVYNESNITTGLYNESIQTVTFTYVDIFEWNCLATNNVSESDWAISNFSIQVSLPPPPPPPVSGGGVSIPTPEEIIEFISICIPFEESFFERLAVAREEEDIFERIKLVWQTFWDYILCNSAASIVPI